MDSLSIWCLSISAFGFHGTAACLSPNLWLYLADMKQPFSQPHFLISPPNILPCFSLQEDSCSSSSNPSFNKTIRPYSGGLPRKICLPRGDFSILKSTLAGIKDQKKLNVINEGKKKDKESLGQPFGRHCSFLFTP